MCSICSLAVILIYIYIYFIAQLYNNIYVSTWDGVYIHYIHMWAGVEKIRRRARHDLMGCHKSAGRPVRKDIMTADVDRRPRIAVNKRAADVVGTVHP